MNNSRKIGIGGLILASAAVVSALSMDEGTRYKPYRDLGGVWTVCQGVTGEDVILGKTYTKQECKQLLDKHILIAGQAVLSCAEAPLNQYQYDAFVRFTYNVGGDAFCKSTLVKKLNEGDYTGACNQLQRWVYIDGKFSKGLKKRRESERKLCLTPVESLKIGGGGSGKS